MKTIETMLFNALSSSAHSRLDQAKLHFGIRLIISNVSKLIIVYTVAALLDCFVPMFVAHVVFFLLRQVSFGYHFDNEWTCILWSIIAFPVTSHILTTYVLPSVILYFIGLLSILLIMLKSPVGTEKHHIINERHRQYLRRKLFFRIIFIGIIFIFSSHFFQQFIVLGLAIQSSVLGIQLLKRKEDVR
ncbi:accessory gene regulator ArgB-like protein [Priestia endophytica]|uniref:Accessory gene regulator B n=1 Tax=Priestia endophytica TaxID=135735 RepID=A0AAX1QFQ2_9BACI|nr:accessory gene regulator B family protein [Priestia endophytica]RAS81737.1 hypothetical protein A3864_02610 [Priestia endophytica]RAS91399.1 hypothetical protein A3863_05810 [Priestia endophytica]